jgi:1-acyl-sn-glycerol-3-phosphate acyltransferase
MQVVSSSSKLYYAHDLHSASNENQHQRRNRKAIVIKATHHPVFSPFWRWYIKNSLRGHFTDVRLFVPEGVQPLNPMLWHATHVSFWDGYLALEAARFLGLEYRVMMLEENLKKFSFLRFAGAFGLERGSARGALESLRYAAQELHHPIPRAVLMFPSGEIGSPHQRPLAFESGIATLASLAAKQQEVLVCPLAIRLEHGEQEKPQAFLRFGQPRHVQAGSRSASLTNLFQDDLTRTADTLHQDLIHDKLESYQSILQGHPSIPEWWDKVRQRFFAKLPSS